MSKETDKYQKDYVKLYDRTDVEATKATRKYIDERTTRDEEVIQKHLAKLKKRGS
jgi:hypothetical protein